MAASSPQERAQAKAAALYEKLKAGEDVEEDTRAFLALGSSVPDGLVLAAIGTRQTTPCPRSLRALLEGKANPNAVDNQTQGSAIHTACWHSSVEIVRILLDHKADMESAEPRMKTPPLNTALAAGNAKVCLELLNRNADVLWAHHDGATPLHVASYWISASHNAELRLPPMGEEPVAVIHMMLHNGVDPLQTEGMSRSSSGRSQGMTPLESLRRQVRDSPWRSDPQVGPKFDHTVGKVHALLEKGEQAMKYKGDGNKAFGEKRYQDAVASYDRALGVWRDADIRGHHSAVLWSNQATCHRKLEDFASSKEACEEGLKHYTSSKIKKKLEDVLKDAELELAKPPEQREQERLERPAPPPRKEPTKLAEAFIEKAEKPIYEGDSAQGKVDRPGPFICGFEDAKEAGMVDGVDGWKDRETRAMQALDEELVREGLMAPDLLSDPKDLDLINRLPPDC